MFNVLLVSLVAAADVAAILMLTWYSNQHATSVSDNNREYHK